MLRRVILIAFFCQLAIPLHASTCIQAALNWYEVYRNNLNLGHSPKGPQTSQSCPLQPNGSLSAACVTLIAPYLAQMCSGNENSTAPAQCMYAALMYNPGVTSVQRAAQLCAGSATPQIANTRYSCSMTYVSGYYPSWNWGYYNTYNPWLYTNRWPYNGGYGPVAWSTITGVVTVSNTVNSGAVNTAYSGGYVGAYAASGFSGSYLSSIGWGGGSSGSGFSSGGSGISGGSGFSSTTGFSSVGNSGGSTSVNSGGSYTGGGYSGGGYSGGGYSGGSYSGGGFSSTGFAKRFISPEEYEVDDLDLDEHQLNARQTWAYSGLITQCNPPPQPVVIVKSGAEALCVAPWLLGLAVLAQLL